MGAMSHSKKSLCDSFGKLKQVGKQKHFFSHVPVAHTYNPSYSGSRDQEDQGSKPTQANSLRDTCLKKPFTKKVGLVEWLKVKALSSSPSTVKKKNKNKNKNPTLFKLY
jgi:hypothetical protein